MGEVTLVEAYNPNWPSWFEQLKAFVAPVLVGVPHAVEHVGSTAIPGMTAKPIIDMLIVVDESLFSLVKDRLATLGYVHQGDLGITDREAFDLVDRQAKRALPYHHLYVCMQGAVALREQLCFRNFLRKHPEWVGKLSRHKVQLCERYANDRQCYISGKAAMVREVTDLAVCNSELAED